jgi:hypothetical protein
MAALPLWMAEVPAYEIVNGNMQVSLGDFSLQMPINVFLVGCAKGKAAIVKWEGQRRTAEVIRFPGEPATHS